MWRWCWLVTLAACRFQLPSESGGADASADSSSQTDAPTDARSALCFGSFLEVCLVSAPGSSLTANSGATLTIDTQTGSADCVPTVSDVGACVVAATSIDVNGTIRGTGPRPLILLAVSSIAIQGTGVIDVASHRSSAGLGAGANSTRCVPGAAPTVATGGWGGSNAGKGGDGNAAGPGSVGGNASFALSRPAGALFGGCAGGKGAGTAAGSGGGGGGAVDLIAASITINGVINASGAGANGASNNNAGGGGGGSGGLIVLDAPDVTINGSAKVFAQGGGGGEGGPTGGGTGGHGMDPTTPGQAALGGIGGGTGGDGGAGATTTTGGAGGNDGGNIDDGGGGGGGGAGFIITTDPTPPGAPTSRVCPTFS